MGHFIINGYDQEHIPKRACEVIMLPSLKRLTMETKGRSLPSVDQNPGRRASTTTPIMVVYQPEASFLLERQHAMFATYEDLVRLRRGEADDDMVALADRYGFEVTSRTILASESENLVQVDVNVPVDPVIMAPEVIQLSAAVVVGGQPPSQRLQTLLQDKKVSDAHEMWHKFLGDSHLLYHQVGFFVVVEQGLLVADEIGKDVKVYMLPYRIELGDREKTTDSIFLTYLNDLLQTLPAEKLVNWPDNGLSSRLHTSMVWMSEVNGNYLAFSKPSDPALNAQLADMKFPGYVDVDEESGETEDNPEPGRLPRRPRQGEGSSPGSRRQRVSARPPSASTVPTARWHVFSRRTPM